jgi:2-dehydro-3-deoxygluconokinase
MTGAIVMFGELLLRLNPEGFTRLTQARTLRAYFTGGEANAGVALVNWGHEVRMVSRVPAHEMGQACIQYLREFGLDTRFVQREGDHLGLLYLESGTSQRPSKIIYDRQGSAFTTFSDERVDWDEIFAGAGWFHFTGTAPAVSLPLVPVLKRACAAARRSGARISCDLNYRSKLWGPDEAARTMQGLLEGVDLFVCGVEDAGLLFGLKPGHPASAREAADAVARQLSERFGFSHVAVPLRESHSASSNRYGAMLYTEKRATFSRSRDIFPIVDRVGAGDALMAGLIHGITERWAPARTVEFAAAAACLKHTIPGDFNLVSLEEVQRLELN